MSEINLYSIESEVNAIKQSRMFKLKLLAFLVMLKDQNRLENIIDLNTK